jgi:hypothetical protein
MKKYSIIFATMMLFMVPVLLYSQEEKAMEDVALEKADDGPGLLFGADFMSRYVWRGIDFGNSPAIQPNIAFSWKGFSIGAWGSYGLSSYSIQIDDSTVVDMGNYAETDFYVSYTYKWFTLMVFDFFLPNGLNPNDANRFFNLDNVNTGHTIEGSLTFTGPENFPLQLLVGTLLYGNDKDQDSSGVYGMGDNNNYSTYCEANYNFSLEKLKMDIKPFIGASLKKSSWYGLDPGIINLGFTAKKEIPISSQFSLPVQFSLITNPQAQRLFFVFGITI